MNHNSSSTRNFSIPEEPIYVPSGNREPYNRAQQRTIQENYGAANNEEDDILAKVLEESKQQTTMNTDNMSYEQILALEEGNGKVSKGLS